MLTARLGRQGSPLVRLRPFPAGLPGMSAEAGKPEPAGEAAGALLAAVAQAGGSVILQVTPPTVAVTPQAWKEAVTQAVRQYGTDPKYGVLSFGAEWPVMQTCMPPSWPPLPWLIERMRQ